MNLSSEFKTARFSVGDSKAKVGTLIKIPIDSVRNEIYVRKEIPDGIARVYIGKYLDVGAEALPPIKITHDLAVIDGRIRLHAARIAGVKDLWAEVYKRPDTMAEFYKLAYQFNQSDSPSQPTEADTVQTLRELFRCGQDEKQVLETCERDFGFSPRHAKSLVSDAYSTIRRDQRRKFLDNIAEGMNKFEAAAAAGVSTAIADNCLNVLKRGTNRERSTTANMTQKFLITQTAMLEAARRMEAKYFDGIMGKDSVDGYFAKCIQLARKMEIHIKERQNRFNAQAGVEVQKKKLRTSRPISVLH